MPRQPTLIEKVQTMLIKSNLLQESEETRKGIWGPNTKEAYIKAIWETAYPDGVWTWDQCKIAAKTQPEAYPMDLAHALAKKSDGK